MGNNEIERNSQIFHEKLDECIPLKTGILPSLESKENKVGIINEFVFENRKFLPVLYRYSPADEYNVSGLIEGNVYLVSAERMNDAHEGEVWHPIFDKEENREYKELMQKHVYLKSFSEDGNSEYMWVNYAENFAGMCVAYDFRYAPEDLLEELYPIQYSPIGFRCTDNKIAMSTPYLFMRKSMKWQAEREWRFIKPNVFNHDEAIPKDVAKYICAVYFGSDMDNDLKNKIEYELFLSNCKLMQRKYRRHIVFYDVEPTMTIKKRDEKDYGNPNF